ncbi:MAG: PD-(D/E)XK nuclease family protein [Butyrivibrio sp.]|nr:PD-(D/E)XK nuclease family protein [Butyrivibrio sp.]
MSLQILMGASGHGKSFTLYSRITKEAKERRDCRFVIVVPEQSSLQTEKDIVRMSENGGVFNIEVLTFGRMCYRIFDELGIELAENIDDTGKNLIVRKVLERVGKSLAVIKPGKRQGFVSEVKSMISELKQYGITPEELKELSASLEAGDRLKRKLADIQLIYEGFEEYIRDRYTTAEDRPEAMLGVMERSGFFRGAVVAFDGFTGFTPVQYRILEKITAAAERVIITAALPEDVRYNVTEGEEDLFAMSKTMIAKAGALADRLMQPFSCEYLKTDYANYRFVKSDELDFLERNIFRYNQKTYGGEARDIRLYRLDNIREELRLAAAKILAHVREDGLRFRDIAVVAGDMDMYADEAVRIFGESGIPFFIDAKRSLIGNPLVEYIRAALEIVNTDFSYESVFRFMKNGLCGLDMERTDLLENYVLARGIRGKKRWENVFEGAYRGKTEAMDGINEARQAFFDKIRPLCEAARSRDGSVSDYVLAVYKLIEAENAYERMEELADRLEMEKPGDLRLGALAAEYRQSYGRVVGLLEQTDSLMGDENIGIKEFAQILDAGFEEIKVGIIPPSVDCVTVGDIERTRLEHVRVLFMLGVNEGVIPKLAANKGVLSETERRTLSENDVELAPTPRERVFIQNFYLYLTMTEPERALYMLCHKFDAAGKESRPSRIFSMVAKMFPRLSVHEGAKASEMLTNPDNSAHLLMDGSVSDGLLGAMLAFFTGTEPYASRLRALARLTADMDGADSLTRTAAGQLYGEIKSSSITRIETFAGCAFAHFARYGLELEERRLYEVNAADMGTVFHKAIEMLSEGLAASGRSFADISGEERTELVRKAVDGALEACGISYFDESETGRFLRRRITDITERTVWALGKQLERGVFVPEEFERVFRGRYESTEIGGKIDRVDSAKRDGKLYVKVVDYKSGRSDLSLDEIYAGLKLQLMVYLQNTLERAAKENTGTEVVAAGAFYNRIDNPMVPYVNGASDGDYERALLKELRPTGAVGLESAELMDSWESAESLVIPAKRRKDGLLQTGGHIYTDAQLKCLADFAVGKLAQLEMEINRGAIGAEPYEGSCDYCPYGSVCGFGRNGEKNYRKTERITGEPDMWLKFGYKEEG